MRGFAPDEARQEASRDLLGCAGREAAPHVDARAGGKAGEHLERALLRLHGSAVEEMDGNDEPALQDEERRQLGRGRRERGPPGRQPRHAAEDRGPAGRPRHEALAHLSCRRLRVPRREPANIASEAVDVEVGRGLLDQLQEGLGQHPGVYHRRGRCL